MVQESHSFHVRGHAMLDAMDASKGWAIAALVFGLVGAGLNAKASDFLIRRTGGYGMPPATLKESRRWSWPGWFCIGAAFVCGFVAEVVRPTT